MRHQLLAVAAAVLFSIGLEAQEIVIFKDYRSLAVTSHREQGKWTYLRIPEGEFAVLTRTILEFRKEPSSPPPPPQAPSASPATSPPSRNFAPEPAPPAPPEEPPLEAEEEPPPPPEPPPNPDQKKKAED